MSSLVTRRSERWQRIFHKAPQHSCKLPVWANKNERSLEKSFSPLSADTRNRTILERKSDRAVQLQVRATYVQSRYTRALPTMRQSNCSCKRYPLRSSPKDAASPQEQLLRILKILSLMTRR